MRLRPFGCINVCVCAHKFRKRCEHSFQMKITSWIRHRVAKVNFSPTRKITWNPKSHKNQWQRHFRLTIRTNFNYHFSVFLLISVYGYGNLRWMEKLSQRAYFDFAFLRLSDDFISNIKRQIYQGYNFHDLNSKYKQRGKNGFSRFRLYVCIAANELLIVY